MDSRRATAIEILRHNVGFRDPDLWIEYALQHSFARISATPIPTCPDCGSQAGSTIGQYVYYSTLMHLLECKCCHLIWSDAHLDPSVVAKHFETAYKDRDYFVASRSWIFEHLATEICRLTPPGGRVLDIGGAQGDLMQKVIQNRLDIQVIVQDLSEDSVRHAKEQFGLRTLCGDIGTLGSMDIRFDVVVLSDVLYYEPKITEFWRVLARIVAPQGSVILRVPNKLLLIRAHRTLQSLIGLGKVSATQDGIKHFNPEHIYILSRRYLTSRLRQVNIRSVRVVPSPPLTSSTSNARRLIEKGLFQAATAIGALSSGRAILTPSMLIIGTRI